MILLPLPRAFHHPPPAKPEVIIHHVLPQPIPPLRDQEPIQRRMLQRIPAPSVVVGNADLQTPRRFAQIFVARLVLDGIIHEDHRLDAHQHRCNRRFVRLPFGFRSTGPGAEKGEADFAVAVEIRVEPDPSLASRGDPHHWRFGGVLFAAHNVEFEEATFVRGPLRADDEGFHDVRADIVDDDENILREGGRHFRRLRDQAGHAVLRGASHCSGLLGREGTQAFGDVGSSSDGVGLEIFLPSRDGGHLRCGWNQACVKLLDPLGDFKDIFACCFVMRAAEEDLALGCQVTEARDQR